MLMKIEEGYMPFLGHKSYYRIVGEPSRKITPCCFCTEVPV